MAQRERSIRLTNHLRECFIRAVSNDIPVPVKPTADALQSAMYESWPESIRMVYDDEETRSYLKTQWWYPGDGRAGVYLTVGGKSFEDMSLYAAYMEAATKRNDAMQKLRGITYGVTTLKALREALPDLVKYMADEAKPITPGLPVVAGLYDDLKALGLKL